MQSTRFKHRGISFLVFLCLVLLLGINVRAEYRMVDMTAADLLEEADILLKDKDYDGAIPYLEMYLQKFGDSTVRRVMAMAQDVRFKYGKVKVFQAENSVDPAQAKVLYADAAKIFKEYAGIRPAPKWHEAMKLMSTSLFEAEQYETCVDACREALVGPTNEIYDVIDNPAETDENKEVKPKVDEFGEIVVGSDSAAEEITDPSGYPRSDIVILNMTLAKALDSLADLAKEKRDEAEKAVENAGEGADKTADQAQMQEQQKKMEALREESISPYLYVSNNETDPVRRGYAIMKVIEAMLDLQKFDKLLELLPSLYNTDARYDIRVNLALMKAASSLFEAKMYDEALPLYRMILPREKLIEYQTLRVKKLQLDAGIITADQLTEEERVKIGVEETLMGKKHDVITEEFWHERGEDPNVKKPPELIELENLIDTLVNLPPYEKEVVFRNAKLYDAVDRPWEAFRLFDGLYRDKAESSDDEEIANRAFYESTRILLDVLGGGEEAEARSYAYLDTHKKGITPRQIAYLLTEYYQKKDQMPAVKKLLPYLKGFEPSDRPVVLKYEAELFYMQAVADLVMMNYEKAEDGFKYVLKTYPGSHQEDNCSYWHAMCLMFTQKYEEAKPEFEAYLRNFPKGAWIPSVNFQLGTCEFGLEDYKRAMELFTTVIDNYPDSAPYPDACSMRGDIYGAGVLDDSAEGGGADLDLAVADYKEAIRAANAAAAENRQRSERQCKYATFQLATAYELEKKYPEILTVVNNYMDFYGDDADLSKGIYWIGKTLINQGRVDEAVDSYVNAILKYGHDLKQDGVDSMISELVGGVYRKLNASQREKMHARIQEAVKDADNITLQLRLRAMLALLDKDEVSFGESLIKELDDLSVAAAPVLSAICKASFESGDYSRSKEILDVFRKQFDDSEFIRSAYKLRAYDLFESGNLDEALKIIEEAQGRFGTDYDMAWAQLMKARIRIKKGDFEDAKKDLMYIFNIPEWRGDAYAEATYRLGEAEEVVNKDLRNAFGWYQRTYFQYKGLAKGYWAAEGYLASARCLEGLGRTNDVRNTYRAMLFDKYVNTLPQAAVARKYLGAQEVLDIINFIQNGGKTNVTVKLDEEKGE